MITALHCASPHRKPLSLAVCWRLPLIGTADCHMTRGIVQVRDRHEHLSQGCRLLYWKICDRMIWQRIYSRMQCAGGHEHLCLSLDELHHSGRHLKGAEPGGSLWQQPGGAGTGWGTRPRSGWGPAGPRSACTDRSAPPTPSAGHRHRPMPATAQTDLGQCS